MQPNIFAGLTVLLVACGGRIKLDQEVVDERLDHVDADVPLCATRDASAASALRGPAQELRAAHRAERAARAMGIAPPPYRSNGSCGGSLDATSEHENGKTDYVITFSAFCMDSDDGQLVVDGVIDAREDGHPTDLGPMIEALDVSTDGPVTVAGPTGTMEITLDDAHTKYGNPSTWMPGTPDEANPDVTTVKRAAVVFVDADDREDYVRDLRVERTGVGPAVVTITSGEVGTVGEGWVDVRTAEDDPLLVDVAGVRLTGGTVEFLGSGGTVVTVQPAPGETGAFVLTLDGVPYDRDVDCTAARMPVLEAGLGLLTELPIY